MDSVFLNMPNLHFLPCNPVTSKVRLQFFHELGYALTGSSLTPQCVLSAHISTYAVTCTKLMPADTDTPGICSKLLLSCAV